MVKIERVDIVWEKSFLFQVYKEVRMNIYVGNLSYEVTEEDLQKAFEAFGHVESVKVIKDRYTGRSRGFGFVDMPTENEAKVAINDLNGKDLKGRALKVNQARRRDEIPRHKRRHAGGQRSY